MPSKAFSHHLLALLEDADDLLETQQKLLAGTEGWKRWAKGPLNRAVVVTCVSAWEGYVEQVVVEAVDAIHPAAGAPLGMWPVVSASAKNLVGRFHTPNVDNVKKLINDALGLADITSFWSWRGCPVARARKQLSDALKLRHQIAHGVHPRPVIPSRVAISLLGFFRRLGSRTDSGIRDHLMHTFGIVSPWPH